MIDLKTLSISIIIPVYNEEKNIGPCLDSLSCHSDLEIVVIDGGSSDQTVQEATARGVTLLISRPGRGKQQHAGAKASRGNVLLFLHCDTRLPHNFAAHIQILLQQEGVVAGAFRLAIDAKGWGYRIIEHGANLRSTIFSLPYGDQALFMERDSYFAANGFPDQPLLEEVVLLSRLKKLGRIKIVPTAASTSARRWQKHGVVKTTVINQLMLAGWVSGIPPTRLARWYYNHHK